jgi:hypothetical protein
MGIHANIGILNRRAIEAEIDRLIDLLDAADAPHVDLEPEDDMGPDDSDHGDGEDRLLSTPPIWGSDQSKGPINEAAAMRIHYMAIGRPDLASEAR